MTKFHQHWHVKTELASSRLKIAFNSQLNLAHKVQQSTFNAIWHQIMKGNYSRHNESQNM